MNKAVLITGASGAIAQVFSKILKENGFQVHLLSRSSKSKTDVFHWDPGQNKIDPRCFEGVFAIVHLAGESIFGMPWTKSRRKRIISSRVDTLDFLVKNIPSWQLPYIKVLVSASATGIYPANRTDTLHEGSSVGKDFLSNVCARWEQQVIESAQWGGFREVRLRNGIVLDRQSGVYQRLAGFTKFGLGVIPGNGRQFLPWIHIDDVAMALLYAILDEKWSGPYNMVAPQLNTMGELCEKIAGTMNRKIWLPNLPSWALELSMGEMSALLLESYQVVPDRLLQMRFPFKYPTLDIALADLHTRG